MSASDDDRYRHYVAAGHVEGKAAIEIRRSGSTGGTIHHNNPFGTCVYCLHQVPVLLPEGATLTIVPPADALPRSAWWAPETVTLVGNADEPTLSEP